MTLDHRIAVGSLLAILSASPALAAWPPGGVHLERPEPASSNGQLGVGADGTGGSYVVWPETNAQNVVAFRVHRLNASGDPPAGWTTTGVRACSLSTLLPPAIRPDGEGGAYFVWTDFNAVARVDRIGPGGALSPGWPIAGLTASSSAGQADVVASEDGAGGVLMAWRSTSTNEILAQRFLPDGSRASGFPASGLPITSLVSFEKGKFRLRLVRDADRGFWVSFTLVGLDTVVVPSACAVAHLDTGGHLDAGEPVNGHPLSLPIGEIGTLQPYTPVALALDGAGGVFAFTVGGNGNVRAFHVLATLDEDPAWPEGGVVIAGGADWPSNFFPDDENWPVAAGDLAGTAYVGWQSQGELVLRGSRVSLSGAVVPGWSGPPVLTGEMQGALVADAGGVFVSGMAPTSCAHFDCTGPMLLARMNPDGSVAAGWPTTNLPTIDAPGSLLAYGAPFDGPRMVADGIGGVVLAWIDYPEYYAMRFLAGGAVTAVAPAAESSAPFARARFEIGAGVRVSFAIERGAEAKIEVLDVTGRRIAVARAAGGTGAVVVPGTRQLPSGLYFVRVSGAIHPMAAKFVVVR
jgi:hypothetical protein